MTNRPFNHLISLIALVVSAPTFVEAQAVTYSDVTATQSLKAGTSAAAGGLELRQNGIFISKGIYGGPNALLSSDQGTGSRMLWYPQKSAFRAGHSASTKWDDASIGSFSAAFGHGTKAASYAFAIGYSTTAEWGAVAAGNFSVASGSYSLAIGDNTAAIGTASLSMGSGTIAIGNVSTAIGLNTVAYSPSSAAFGDTTKAEAQGSFVIGRRNIGGGDPSSPNETDPIFEIGNGTPADGPIPATNSNAFTVYRNGNVTIAGAVLMPQQGDILMGQFGN